LAHADSAAAQITVTLAFASRKPAIFPFNCDFIL
jgi:hypothetical protein